MMICGHLEKIIHLRFLVLPIFQKKAQNKNKVGIKTSFSLMMYMYKVKIPTQVHIHLGRDERIFLKNRKQHTNILFEQMSSRRKISSDSIEVNHSMCQNTRYHLLGIILHHIDRLCPMIRRWIEMLRSLLSRLVYAQWLTLLLGPLLDLWLILCNCQ